jgi:hypothetical protein
VSIYKDEKISAVRRQAQDPTALVQRENLLHLTSPTGDSEVIYVASLAVLAWSADDFMACLAAAAARGATIVALDSRRRIEPGARAPELAEAVREFIASKRRPQVGGWLIGAAASVASRNRDIEARLMLIADDWPRDDPPTPELLLRAGKVRAGMQKATPMAYQTAAKHLGKRPEARRKHQMTDQRIAHNQARKNLMPKSETTRPQTVAVLTVATAV